MRQLTRILVFLAFAATAAAQTPTPATFNPVPVAGASFLSDLQTYLVNEDASRDNVEFNPFRISGCLHSTAAGFVGTLSVECDAFVSGHYIIEPAQSINYSTVGSASATDVCYLALHKDTTTSVAGWGRKTGTHFLVKCGELSTVRPTLPADTMILQRTTISGSAISATSAQYNRSPYVQTYLNSVEIDVTKPGRVWQDNAAGTVCVVTNAGTCPFILSDASGCASCGDSATAFFTTGALEAARGGTAANTSAWTGVPFVTAGVWDKETAVATVRGGFGADMSGCADGNALTFASGVGSCGDPPQWDEAIDAARLAVDATQCVHASNVALVSGIHANVLTCADNNAGVIDAVTRLPADYLAASSLTLKLVATNTGTTSGDTSFDVTCLCANDVSGTTLSAGNFPSTSAMTMTWSGTAGQEKSKTVTMACGGSCAASNSVHVRLTVNATATTHSTPSEIKYTVLDVRASTTL